jgi:AraC-like DNA-binding protein
MASETYLVTSGLIFLRLLELFGIDQQRFSQLMGLDPIRPPDEKARAPSRQVDVGFTKAAALIRDPAFALRAGECWHPSNLGTLGYAWMSSGTLRKALKRLARFSRILGQKAITRCVEGPDGVRLIYDPRREDTTVGNLLADFSLSLYVSMCRANFGPSLKLERVTLRRSAPANAQPYMDLFACPIDFGAADNSFLLAPDIADRPLLTANQELAKTFDSILTAQLAELTESNLESRCKAYLLDQLTTGEPSEQDLANALAMSRRTLQRRLADLGLTYKNVLDATRYNLALRYLADPQKTVTDITFLLGFSEQSAFSRAFKRWSGKAPMTYRSELTGLS